MGDIRSSIQLFDGMTPALRSMTNSMNIVISSFRTLQTESGRAVDIASLDAAQEELRNLESSFDDIEDSIKKSESAQKKFNNNLDSGGNLAQGLESKIARIAAAAAAAFGAEKMIELSDNLTLTTSRIDLMNDGLQTTEELQKKIFESAERSRGNYLDNIGSVSKLGILAGDAFTSNDEMVEFVELMNKNFVIAGASTSEQSSAMYQLTQALASGRLQGDEYRSIIENAPLLASAIEDYMRGAGVEGTMKEWASDGLLTADVIKNALFNSADEIEERFESIPMTWGQVWQSTKNNALIEFEPILDKINQIANSDRFEEFTEKGIDAMGDFADSALNVFEKLEDVAIFIYDNWEEIEPLVYGVVAAYAAWEIATKGVATAHMLLSASVNPLYLVGIAAGVGVAVGAYTALDNTIENLIEKEKGLSSTIDITGESSYIAAQKTQYLMNQFEVLIDNVVDTEAEHDKLNTIVSELEKTIPGLNDEIRDETGYVDDLSEALRNAADKFYDLATAQAYYGAYSDKLEEVVRKKADLEEKYGLYKDFKENRNMGLYSVILEKYQDEDGTTASWWEKSMTDENYYNNFMGEIERQINDADSLAKTYFDKMSEYQKDAADYDDLYGKDNAKNQEDTARNTETISNAVTGELTEELKYIRDLAERDVINQFTTAKVNVDLGVVQNVNSEQDLDGIITYIVDNTSEQLSIMAEAHSN